MRPPALRSSDQKYDEQAVHFIAAFRFEVPAVSVGTKSAALGQGMAAHGLGMGNSQ
jgi:hypothetical protein